MRLGEIDFSKKIVSPKLYLCKPNKEIISILKESFNVMYSEKLGALNELSFKIPVFIDNKHMLVRNNNSDNIKGRYLIRLVLGNLEEYFIINKIGKVGNNEEYLEVKSLSLGYELNDKLLRDFEAESLNATSLLKDVLRDTLWSIGYIDSEFDLKYRSLKISSNTVLEVVFEIAKTFNAITVWDSINRKVSLYKPDSVGEDKGFKIKYGKYLESLNQEDNAEEIITRLKLYGSEGISIREINPTGTTFIEDFSYFIHPYKEERLYSEKIYDLSNINDDWEFDANNWHYVEDSSITCDGLTTDISKMISLSEDTLRNYKVTATIIPKENDGKFGFIVRHIDDLNYYLIQWEHGSPNPTLDSLEELLSRKIADRDDIISSIDEVEDELFLDEAELKTLNDEIVVLNNRINSCEALIVSERARGNNTSHLEAELERMQLKLRDIVERDIPLKEAEIQLDKDVIENFTDSLEAIKLEITQIESDIAVEKLAPRSNKLKVLKSKDGVLETIAESEAIRGWSHDVSYKMSVEVHNNTIMVWVDNVLVLDCYEDEYDTGTFGLFSKEQVLEILDIKLEIKDYNTLSHSDYMSDDLAHYILEYDRLLQAMKEEFSNLLAVKKQYDSLYYVKQGELNHLETQHKILLDERDVLNTRIAKLEDDIDHADNTSGSTDVLRGSLQTLKNQLEVKLMEITAKETEVSQKESELMRVELDIDEQMFNIKQLNVILGVENNFTKQLLDERNQFIIEKEWSDNNIEDPEDLLKEGIEVFNELRQQKITLKLELVNFLGMITEQRNWDKLNLGDTFRIEQERLKVSYKAKLTEVDYNFDESSIDVKITNIKDTNRNKFMDMIYSSYSSSTTVNMDKWKWDLSLENKGSINEIINNNWDANKQKIIGAKDQVVELSDRGLIIRDPNDPMSYLVGLNSMIAITNDGGQTWKHAITSTGIVGERIYGKVIMGVNLAIEDEDGVIKWQGSKGEIFDRTGRLVMKLGLISEPPESTYDCFGLVANNEITRVKISDCVGFSIEQWHEEDWRKVLWANTDGTLYAYGLVVKNIKIVNNVDELILDAENNLLNLGLFKDILVDGKLTTLEKLQLISELYKIHSDYKLLLEQAGEYKRVHRDDIVDTEGAFDTETQSLPTTPSVIDRYTTDPLATAYSNLMNYMSQYVKIIDKGIGINPLVIDASDPLTESTSVVEDRGTFIQKLKDYYDEAEKLRQAIQDTLYYSGINMGINYNNIMIGEYGLIVMRNDGKYRAFLNATNGLALQKWETNKWVNKLYASIGNDSYEDGTLIAEDLVAKRLTIITKDGKILLDADSLKFDFTVLDSIIYDDIIMSMEKATLLTQFSQLTEQKNKLKEQILRYASTIYNDRDNSYYGLDLAKANLLSAEQQLDIAYNNLAQVLSIVFADMNSKTVISTDLNMSAGAFRELFKIFSSAYETCRNRLEDFLEKSSLQLGRDYNNTVIDAENGITVTRNNMMTRTRLNATQGIEIARNDGTYGSPIWTPVFYVNTEGNLYAVDITTHGLKIVDGNLGEKIVLDENDGITIYGNNGEVIRLNANEGIAIDVNFEKRLWIGTDGTLRARKLVIESDLGETILDDDTDGFISRLTVNRLKTLNNNSPQDYVFIADNFIKIMTGTSASSDIEKFRLEIAETQNPKMTFGAGMVGSSNDKGYIEKTMSSFDFKYQDGSGIWRKVELLEGSGNSGGVNISTGGSGKLRLEVNSSNYIEITSSGVKIVGTRIDLN